MHLCILNLECLTLYGFSGDFGQLHGAVVAGNDWAVFVGLLSFVRIDGNVMSILKTKLPLRRLNRLAVCFKAVHLTSIEFHLDASADEERS